MWNTKSIEGMEQTAREEADQDCSKKIGNYYLCVTWTGGDNFTYQWGKNFITRDAAVNVHKIKI